MAKKKVNVTSAQKLGIGVGLTAAAVAAAGAYFLYGSPDAPENRKKVKSGVLKAKAEVLEALENAKGITEEDFHALVDQIAKAYSKANKLSKADVKEFKAEMVENWDSLVASGVTKVMDAKKMAEKFTAKKAPKKTAKKRAKKTVKKATKKAAKKVAKKSK